MSIVLNGSTNNITVDNVDVATDTDLALKAPLDGSVLTDATIQLTSTTWTNEDGIEYFDEGLLGVPDTTFSSTGARIYPDGTIRGNSSYGEYVKYPDGRLECSAKQVVPTMTSNSEYSWSGADGFTNNGFSFPFAFYETPKASFVIDGNNVGLNRFLTGYLRNIANNYMTVQCWWDSNSNGYSIHMIAIGRWK